MSLPRPTHQALLVIASGAVCTAAVLAGLVLLHLLVVAMGGAALDDALERRSAPLVREVSSGDLDPVRREPYAQVLEPGGAIVARSPSAPHRPMLSGPALRAAQRAPVDRDVRLAGVGESRVHAVGVTVRSSPLVLVVADPRDAVDLFVDRHRHVVLVLFPLLVLILVAAAFRLVRATLRPVRWLTDESLAAAEGKREAIRESPGEDEVSGLSRSLNLMLRRVRTVEGRERTFVQDATTALLVPVGVLKGELRHALTLTEADEVRRSLRLSAAEAERIATLTADLAVLAHERSGTLDVELTDIELTDCVERAARALRAALGVNVTVTGDPVRASCDRLRVEQAVTYLLANSVAAGATQVAVTVRQTGSFAVLEVADDGPGFPAELLPTALEPFTRAEGTKTPRTAGAGLGLAVVAALVRAHGGQTVVDNASALGGARVCLELPTEPADGHRPGELTGHQENGAAHSVLSLTRD